MWGEAHGFDYNQQDRFVIYECKCSFRIALMYYKSFLSPTPLIIDSKNRRPLSVIWLQEGEYGCILCGNKFISVFCGTQWITNNDSICVFFACKLASRKLLHNITNASLEDKSISWILLPKINEPGLPIISDNNKEPACHTLIDSNWHTMQQDKSITSTKFPGASYDYNILAENNDELEGPDKIWYWCIIYYTLMLICCCHWWWYIIFDYYCCYAPFITTVYWWYLTKHCLASNCNTGWTHLCRTHHDRRCRVIY